MSQVDRRSFLQVGVAAATSLAIPSSLAAHDPNQPHAHVRSRNPRLTPVVRSLRVGPGFVDDSLSSDGALWAYNPLTSDIAAQLSRTIIPDAETMAAWLQAGTLPESGDEATIQLARAIATALPLGGYSVSDTAATMLTSVLSGEDFDVALEFLADGQQPIVDQSKGVPMVLDGVSSRIVPFETPYPHIDLGNYRFQYRPNHLLKDQHSLGTCAPFGSPHIHFDTFYSKNPKVYGWGQPFTLHLGKFKQGSKNCFFLSTTPDQKGKYVCLSTCVPSFGELQRLYQAAILYAASVFGVAVAAWLVSSTAYTLASLTFGVMLAL